MVLHIYLRTYYDQIVFFDLRDEMSQQFELPERNPQSEYALEAYREKLAGFRMWRNRDRHVDTKRQVLIHIALGKEVRHQIAKN